MKHKFIGIALISIAAALATNSCGNAKSPQVEKFHGTEAYALMVAVNDEDTDRIKGIAIQHLYILNLSNLKDGEPAIAVAVQLDKFESFRALLNSGADPNLSGFKAGTSATDYAKQRASSGDTRYIDAINAMMR